MKAVPGLGNTNARPMTFDLLFPPKQDCSLTELAPGLLAAELLMQGKFSERRSPR